jgi:hypothetical protein
VPFIHLARAHRQALDAALRDPDFCGRGAKHRLFVALSPIGQMTNCHTAIGSKVTVRRRRVGKFACDTGTFRPFVAQTRTRRSLIVSSIPKRRKQMSDTDQNSADVIGLALAHEAVRWLATRCDGAVAADKQGFAATDAGLGRALAAKLSWTPRELGAAAQIVLKYSKQLRRSTLDVAALSRFAQAIRQDGARKLRVDEIVVGKVWICKDSQRLMLKSTYHSSVKETFKQLVGARWNSSEARWECDPTAENADALRELARAHGLTVEESLAWSSLVSARRVQLDGDRVVVTGVAAYSCAVDHIDVKGRNAVVRGAQRVAAASDLRHRERVVASQFQHRPQETYVETHCSSRCVVVVASPGGEFKHLMNCVASCGCVICHT